MALTRRSQGNIHATFYQAFIQADRVVEVDPGAASCGHAVTIRVSNEPALFPL